MSLNCTVAGSLNRSSGWIPEMQLSCQGAETIEWRGGAQSSTQTFHTRASSALCYRQCFPHVPDHENQPGGLFIISILELHPQPAKLELEREGSGGLYSSNHPR